MTLITQGKFSEYREAFHSKASRSPMVVTVTRSLGKTAEDAFTEFIGEGEEVFVTRDVKCLYRRVMNDEERDKYGWSRDVDGVLYMSPKSLIDAFGSFKVHSEKDTFLFNRRRCKVDQIEYLEPFYGSCISVRVAISTIKGEHEFWEEDRQDVSLTIDMVDYALVGTPLDIPYSSEYRPIVFNQHPEKLQVVVEDSKMVFTGLETGETFLKILVPKTSEHGASKTIVKKVIVVEDIVNLLQDSEGLPITDDINDIFIRQ